MELLKISKNGLFMSWHPPMYDNGSGIRMYEIEVRNVPVPVGEKMKKKRFLESEAVVRKTGNDVECENQKIQPDEADEAHSGNESCDNSLGSLESVEDFEDNYNDDDLAIDQGDDDDDMYALHPTPSSSPSPIPSPHIPSSPPPSSPPPSPPTSISFYFHLLLLPLPSRQ